METIVALVLVESFLVNTITALEIKRRRSLLVRWTAGHMSMAELRLLKKQPWFRARFPEKVVPREKKND
jgi:hypothetical protein